MVFKFTPKTGVEWKMIGAKRFAVISAMRDHCLLRANLGSGLEFRARLARRKTSHTRGDAKSLSIAYTTAL